MTSLQILYNYLSVSMESLISHFLFLDFLLFFLSLLTLNEPLGIENSIAYLFMLLLDLFNSVTIPIVIRNTKEIINTHREREMQTDCIHRAPPS